MSDVPRHRCRIKWQLRRHWWVYCQRADCFYQEGSGVDEWRYALTLALIHYEAGER